MIQNNTSGTSHAESARKRAGKLRKDLFKKIDNKLKIKALFKYYTAPLQYDNKWDSQAPNTEHPFYINNKSSADIPGNL